MTANDEAGDGVGEVRPLTIDDFQAVVAIDSKLSGSWRQAFFSKRLAAALEKPKDFIYVGVDRDGALAGFAFAHLLEGEFGGTGTVAVLDAIGVDPDRQGAGIGHRLMDGLIAVMKHKGVREMQTQVDWRDHDLMRFCEASGFVRAPRLVLERDTGSPFLQ
ncbi:MAG: GNAT family N-acetyltransferase [Alphaproteobacteria bacterium]|nr:GNAT family N-acetyltransferase [Alphaproteobacteria bacterium]